MKFPNDPTRHEDSDNEQERRKSENRLRRIARENDLSEESRIQKWLDLGEKLFDDPDDDPTRSAA